MANDYSGLFTTPQELQANTLNQLQKRQAAISGMGGSYDALLGQIAAGGGTTGAMMAQGIKSMFGLQTQPEMQAQKMQDRLAAAKGDYAGLMALGQELMNDGNMKDAYAVMSMAKEIKPEAEEAGVNIMDTNDMKNIAAIGASEFGCDVRKDPQCFLKAKESYINLKRADTAQQKMEVFGYEGLVKKRDEATAAARSIETINESLRTLDSGNVNIGSFPETRQGAMKFASQVFGWEEGEQTVARTAKLMAQTKALAGELLASGMFGAGTGISERDLLTAQEMAGAANTLTPSAMKQILEYNAKMNELKIKKFNERLDRYSPEFFARTPEGDQDAFYVGTPEVYQMQNIGVPKEPDKVPVFEGDMMFMVPKGAVMGTFSDGTRGYVVGDKKYTLEGEEIK